MLLGGLEPPLLAPEANALSAELQEREADFTIKYKTPKGYKPSGVLLSDVTHRPEALP